MTASKLLDWIFKGLSMALIPMALWAWGLSTDMALAEKSIKDLTAEVAKHEGEGHRESREQLIRIEGVVDAMKEKVDAIYRITIAN